jgi:hypothetical protein
MSQYPGYNPGGYAPPQPQYQNGGYYPYVDRAGLAMAPCFDPSQLLTIVAVLLSRITTILLSLFSLAMGTNKLRRRSSSMLTRSVLQNRLPVSPP